MIEPFVTILPVSKHTPERASIPIQSSLIRIEVGAHVCPEVEVPQVHQAALCLQETPEGEAGEDIRCQGPQDAVVLVREL